LKILEERSVFTPRLEREVPFISPFQKPFSEWI
jgi:hypothetical protein